MSGYKVNNTDLDDLYATYTANTTYSANFLGQVNNPTVSTNYQVGGSDLSTRYVEFSKLGSALKGTRPESNSGYKYKSGSDYVDIKNLYVAIGTIAWSAAIKSTAISLPLRTGTSLTIIFSYYGFPTKIDAFLTYKDAGNVYRTKTEPYGGTLIAATPNAEAGGNDKTITVNDLPPNTPITYTLRPYIKNSSGANQITVQSPEVTVYTKPEKPIITGIGSANTATNGTTTYTFAGTYDNVLNSFDNKKYGTVGNDSGYTNTSFTLSTATVGTFSFSIKPYDKQTGTYNTDLETAWTLIVSSGTAGWATGNPIDPVSSSGFTANVSGTNMSSVSGTATKPGAGTGTPVAGTVNVTNATVAFVDLSANTSYNVLITVTFNGGDTVTLESKTQSTMSNVIMVLGDAVATANSWTVKITGIVNIKTPIKDNIIGELKLFPITIYEAPFVLNSGSTNAGVVTFDESYFKTSNGGNDNTSYNIDVDTEYGYRISGTGTDGLKLIYDRYVWTLPILDSTTITPGDASVKIKLTGRFKGAQIFFPHPTGSTTLTNAIDISNNKIFESDKYYTFTGLVNGGNYIWTVYLYNRGTSNYDIKSDDITFTASAPIQISSATIELGTQSLTTIIGGFTGAVSCTKVNINIQSKSESTYTDIENYDVIPNANGTGKYTFEGLTLFNGTSIYHRIVCTPYKGTTAGPVVSSSDKSVTVTKYIKSSDSWTQAVIYDYISFVSNKISNTQISVGGGINGGRINIETFTDINFTSFFYTLVGGGGGAADDDGDGYHGGGGGYIISAKYDCSPKYITKLTMYCGKGGSEGGDGLGNGGNGGGSFIIITRSDGTLDYRVAWGGGGGYSDTFGGGGFYRNNDVCLFSQNGRIEWTNYGENQDGVSEFSDTGDIGEGGKFVGSGNGADGVYNDNQPGNSGLVSIIIL